EPPYDQPGGATDLWLLISLCDLHHEWRHKGGWTVAIDPDATITVTSPNGHTTLTETATQRRARHGTWELSTTYPDSHHQPEPGEMRTDLARESHVTYQTLDTLDHERGPARNRGSPRRTDRVGPDSRRPRKRRPVAHR
ncbi:MAG: hypothetical protein KY437_06875, partial [Actinobacteria bacterium]|nr:hypothetical protein [Actinomycetota bacterium]